MSHDPKMPTRKLTPIRILASIATLAALIVVLLWLAPSLIPSETYKTEIHDRLQAMTGRTITIGGDVSLRFLPTVRILAEDVRIGQPATFKNQTDTPFAEVEKLNVSVQFWPLFSKQVVVDKFELIKPAILLMQNAQGVGNWVFQPEDNETNQPIKTVENDRKAIPAIAISELSISQGALTFTPAEGEPTRITDLDAKLNLPGLKQSAKFNVAGLLNKAQKLQLNGEVSTPESWLSGEATELNAKLEAETYGTFSFKGTVTPSSPLRLQGQITADTADATLSGTMTAALPEGQPATVKADLKTTEVLDLSPWLQEKEISAPQANADMTNEADTEIPLPTQKKSDGWSRDDALPDLSALNLLNADITLHTQGLKADDLEIGPFPVHITTQNGTLAATLSDMPLYGGTVNAKATIDTATNITKTVTVQGLQAEPFLTSAADFNRLSGLADLSFSMRTKGRSQHDWVQNMNGNGTLNMQDGQIKGVDVSALAEKATLLAATVFQLDTTEEAEAQTPTTQFLTMGGSFSIAQGILTNNDLAFKGPLVNMSGSGTVNLLMKTVNYVIKPSISGIKSATTETTEATPAPAKNISIPIRVTGPFNQLTFRPDVKNLTESFAADPKGTVDQLENSVKGVRDSIKNLDVKDSDSIKEGLKGLFGQ